MYTDMISAYRRYCYPNAERELKWFREQPTLKDAIEIAALATDHRGVCYDHQHKNWKFWPSAMPQSRDCLLTALDDISQVRTFDELHSLLESKVGGIKGIGELYLYDTSVRIGAYLGLEPERIYLHAGTKRGARALGLDGSCGVLEREELPEDLRCLAPGEAEDFLCIYKDQLGASMGKSPSSCATGSNHCSRSTGAGHRAIVRYPPGGA